MESKNIIATCEADQSIQQRTRMVGRTWKGPRGPRHVRPHMGCMLNTSNYLGDNMRSKKEVSSAAIGCEDTSPSDVSWESVCCVSRLDSDLELSSLVSHSMWRNTVEYKFTSDCWVDSVTGLVLHYNRFSIIPLAVERTTEIPWGKRACKDTCSETLRY